MAATHSGSSSVGRRWRVPRAAQVLTRDFSFSSATRTSSAETLGARRAMASSADDMTWACTPPSRAATSVADLARERARKWRSSRRASTRSQVVFRTAMPRARSLQSRVTTEAPAPAAATAAAKPARPVKAAFVGAGVMGRDHWKNALMLQQSGDLQITGLADTVLDRAKALADEYNVTTFEDYKKLI